jgi:hypothetical protein
MKNFNKILFGLVLVFSSITAFAQTAPNCRVFISKSVVNGTTKLSALAFPTRTGISYKWSNGANTDNITTTQFGDYCVTITGNNCETKTCLTLAPPSCGGGYTSTTNASGTTICLTSALGKSYAWSNGETTKCISVTQAGEYCAIVKGDNCESKICAKIQTATTTTSSTSCSVQITKTATATGFSLCANSISAGTYLWSTGDTSKCISVTKSGSYCVTITAKVGNCISRGCSSVTIVPPVDTVKIDTIKIDTIKIDTIKIDTIKVDTIKKDTTKTTTTTTTSSSCSVQITRTATPTGAELCANSITAGTYLWSTGDTSKCIPVTKSGSYCVTITAKVGNCVARGCRAVTITTPTDTVKIDTVKIDTIKLDTVKVDTIKKDTIKTTTTTTTTTSTGCGVSISRTATATGFDLCANSTTAGTYLWSTGDTSKCISVTKTGSYCVTITAKVGTCTARGCRSVRIVDTTTINNAVNATLRSSNLSSEVSIENAGPNPVGNEYNVSLSSPVAQKVTSKIFDINGKLQSNAEYDINEGSNNLTFDMSGLSGGIYFINIITATNKEVLKVIKQ